MKRAWLKGLPVTVLAAVLLAGVPAICQTLRIGLQDDPDILDPHRARSFVGRIVFTSLCDKLVDVTPDLKIVPQLATSWSWDDARTTLTMKLRTDAKFHDGRPVDAAAVKANLDRALTLPDSLRKAEISSVKSVDVVDPSTVAIHLSKPDGALLSQFSDRAGMMMSPASFEGADTGRKPVCSGPYKFVERVQNDRIVLEKFQDYWDKDHYHFDKVIFTPIPDSTVRLANLQAGDFDLIERVAPTDVPAIEKDPRLKFVSVTGLGYQSFSINLHNGARADNPLKDKRVRQALDLSIDREAIDNVVGLGTLPPARQAYPPASFAYNPALNTQPRDVAKARALIKAAGYDRIPLEIVYGNNTLNQQIYELIQAMAGEAGFDVTLRPMEFAAMQSVLKSGQYQAGQNGWSGRVDPDGNIYPYAACDGNLNDAHYCNKTVDELLNQARQSTDEAQRKALYDKVQAILLDEMPIVYLYYQPWLFAYTAKLKGFVPYPDGMIRLRDVMLQ